MEKNIIGNWGDNLDDDAYAQAVAALGTLEGSGIDHYPATSDRVALSEALGKEFVDGDKTVVWRGAYNPIGTTRAGWQNPNHEDAQALSEAWKLYRESTWHHARLLPRLAVEAAWLQRPDLFNLDALFDLLAMFGISSLSLVPPVVHSHTPRAIWHWPVRVGVPAGPEGEGLLASFQSAASGHDWVGELGKVQKVGEVRDSCDLLILPPGWAERLAKQPDMRLRASFVVCLDEPPAWSMLAAPSMVDLLHKTRSSGIALVRFPDSVEHWYREVIRDLSHDLPLHAALQQVDLSAGTTTRILGFPEYLDRLRILAVAQCLDRRWDSLMQMQVVRPPSLESMQPELEEPVAQAESLVREGDFYHEQASGLPAANEFKEREERIEQRRPPRWIQAAISHAESEAPTAGALAPNQPNLVTVFIGPSDEVRTDKSFPDRDLDFNDGPIPLYVQFESANASIAILPLGSRDAERRYWAYKSDDLREALSRYAEQAGAPEPLDEGRPLIGVATEAILLPEVGNSEPAFFVVWPQAGAPKVTGRIAIIHGNRIVQLATFEAAVGSKESLPERPLVQTEQVIFSRFEDLPGRREGDLNMIVDDKLGNGLTLTRNWGRQSKTVSLGDIEGELENIKSLIYRVTRREEEKLFDNIIEDKIIGEVLNSLAINGAILYNHLSAQDEGMSDVLGVENVERRIQVLSRTEHYFPLEYVYSGPNPDFDATVCPNAAEALKHGRCGGCPHQKSSAYLCPIHFWGWKHVIERHANAQGGDIDPKDVPAPTRTPFGPITPILFAASEKAFNFNGGADEKESLLSALKDLGVLPVEEILDWDQWQTWVKVTQPDSRLIVLLPHTDRINNVDIIEIGQGKRLGKNKIVKGLLGNIDKPKLLLLIGCTTAEVTDTFAPYHGLFQTAGATVIVSSLAKILGRDAVPIAREIIRGLTAGTATGDEIALGELIRHIRRQLLAKGHSGVLGILCFGDADWVFGG